MSVTSLKLPQDLKKRAGFLADAVAARDAMLKTGKGYVAEEVHAYLRNRTGGKQSKRPKAKSWRV